MKRSPAQPPELAGYEYVRLLGSGGFSDVFLYEQRLPRRRVAVKVLLTESLTPQTRRQFADEANLMASLSAHPNIVTIFHADVADDGRPYFVMEYCPGPSLAARYKAEPLSIEEALRIGVRLSSAVATAHAAGILHRDIKPANVLVNEYGSPALTDFGISSGTDDDTIGLTTTSTPLADSSHTGGSTVGLSVPWSPPESFGDDPTPDVRSDIFSLAATIFTLLAGRTPFERPGLSNSQLDLAGRIQRGAITPLDRPDASPSLIAVLAKGMDPLASRRYAKATDFARALQGVEIELGYHPTPLEVPNSTIERSVTPADVAAEETRVRGVATVVAQAPVTRPESPPPSPVKPIAAREIPIAEDSLESTVVRVTAPTVPDARPLAVPRRTRRTPVIIGGLVAVLVVVGVVVAVNLPHPTVYQPTSPSRTASVPDDSPGGALILAPEIEPPVRSEDGTSVTFTWSNPRGQTGDSYVWRRTDGPADGAPNPTSDETVAIAGLAPVEQVCISVWVNRDGQLSPDAASACSP